MHNIYTDTRVWVSRSENYNTIFIRRVKLRLFVPFVLPMRKKSNISNNCIVYTFYPASIINVYLPYVKNNHDSQQYYCNKQYVCKNIQQLIWKSKTHFNVKLSWWMSLDLTVSIPFWIDTTTITVVTFSITVEGELKTLPLNHSYPDSDSLIGGGT